jgi:hypothetical protein
MTATGGIISVVIPRCDADSEGVDSDSEVNGKVDNERATALHGATDE